MARLRIRIEFEGDHSLGPGKIQLLEAVARHGSISAAARSMNMSYRHAWELLDDVNRCFSRPAIETETGGRAGGGARVTDLGHALIERFHSITAKAERSLRGDLEALERARGGDDTPPRTGPDPRPA
jgi:molybdate transport system regulatory protein